MRTVSSGIQTAQESATCTPYISISFCSGPGGSVVYQYDTADSPRRIKNIKHVEEPYNDYAIIVVTDQDNSLPNLLGLVALIDYGYKVSGTPDTTGGESAPLWVTKQFKSSAPGSKDTILYCEGAWTILSRMFDIGSLLGGTSPYYDIEYSTDTVYDIMYSVLHAAGFDLLLLGIHDDSIIDTLMPAFAVNSIPFEDARQQIYRLINMTKCMARVERVGAMSYADEHLVSTNASDNPVPRMHSRSSFYGAGRRWQFWLTDDYLTRLVFSSCVDLNSWDALTDTGAGYVPSQGNLDHWALCYDPVNNHVHIVADNPGYHTGYIMYRMGTPQSDGTMVWAAGWQVVDTLGGGGGYNRVCICLDSDNLPWVTYSISNSNYVNASSTGNGVWTDRTGFPTGLGSADAFGTVIPMLAGKVLVVWFVQDSYPVMRLWNGTGWEADQYGLVAWGNTATFSTLGVGDIAHFIYYSGGRHVQYNGATKEFTDLPSWAESDTNPVLFLRNGAVCCVSYYSGDVFFRVLTGTTWGSRVKWAEYMIDSVVEDAYLGNRVFCTYHRDQPPLYLNSYLYVIELTLPYLAQFRVIYPAIWSDYHRIFTSDGVSLQWYDDSSGNGRVATVYAGASYSDAQYKFSSPGSCLFNGTTTGRISFPTSDDWAFGTGDYTIDFCGRLVSLPGVSGNCFVIGRYQAGGAVWGLRLWNISGTYQMRFRCENGLELAYAYGTLPVGFAVDTWYHFELDRVGGVYAWYLDGVALAMTQRNYSVPAMSSVLDIGWMTSQGASAGWPGYLDELRVSKGIARHSTGFTPPTEPYSVDSYTKLLLHFDGGRYQFKDFEWRDHTLNPTHVHVLANRVNTPEGLWDADEIVLGEYIAP